MSSALAFMGSTAAPAVFGGRRGAVARYVLMQKGLGKGAANARRKTSSFSFFFLSRSLAPSLLERGEKSHVEKTKSEHFDVPFCLILASFRSASHAPVEILILFVSWRIDGGEKRAIQ